MLFPFLSITELEGNMEELVAYALEDMIENADIIEETKDESAMIVENHLLDAVNSAVYFSEGVKGVHGTFFNTESFRDNFRTVVKNQVLTLLVANRDFFEETRDAIAKAKRAREAGTRMMMDTE